MKIEQILKNLNFSKNEIAVYLAAMETGAATANQIAQKAKLQRTTTYSVLGQLVSRGVMAKTKERGRSRFLAEPPDKLLRLVSELREGIEMVLPELEAKYNQKEKKPRILFYEGERAIQEVYDDTLREKPVEILEWNTDAYFGNEKVDRQYIAKRVQLGIRAKRMAVQNSIWDRNHRSRDVEELSETIAVSKEFFSPAIEVNIYNNKIAFLNYAENMSVIVESKAITDLMRQIYGLAWEAAKQLAR